MVYADTRADLEAKLGPRTAMISILTASERQGVFAPPFEAKRAPAPSKVLVPHEELIALGKRAGVPVLVKASPPRRRFGTPGLSELPWPTGTSTSPSHWQLPTS